MRELLTRLGFTTDEAKVRSYLTSINGVKAATTALVAVSTLAGATVLKFVNDLGEQAGELLRLKSIYKISTDELQALRFAAQQSSVSFEALTQGVGFFLRTIGSTGGRSPSDLLAEMADRVRAIQDPAERAEFVVKNFGRAGLVLIPLLEKGSAGVRDLTAEFKRMNFVMDEATLLAANELNDQVNALKGSFRSLGYALGADFLPYIKAAADATREWWIANRELLRQRIKDTLEALLLVLKPLALILSLVVGLIYALADAVGGLENAVKLLIAVVAGRLLLSLAALLGPLIAARVALLAISGPAILQGIRALGGALLTAFRAPLVAVTGLILVLEDLYGFFRGKRSVIGDLLGRPEGFKLDMKQLWEDILYGVDRLTAKLGELWDRLMTWIGDGLDKLVLRIEEMRARVIRLFTGGFAGINVQGGAAPALAGIAAGTRIPQLNSPAARAIAQNFNVGGITVNVPAGTSAADSQGISRAVGEEMRRVWNEINVGHPAVETP